MHRMEEHYHQIIRIFLKTLGLWPYQHSYLALVQKVLFGGILFTFIIVQLLAFFTTQFSTNLLLQILSIVFPTLFATVKYCIFVIKADKVFCHFGTSCYLILQLLPLILDVIVPLNASRSLNLLAITEYFVNREKYACVILLHELLTIYVGTITLCSTGLIFMTHLLHGCALLKVACRRMKHAIQKNFLAMPNPVKEYLLYERIVDIVFIHRRAIQFHETTVSGFMVSIAFLIIIGVTSLSLNLFHLLQLMTVTYDIGEISIIFLLVVFHVNYMFVLNYGGEELQNHGMELFQVTVKMTFVCGGIFVASLEGFVTLVNTAVSYFTVIYSTR
ncbi:hypothetical protein X777_14155 [Ooceraea biroi]|uniref:Odorant receptor n=1 Tax=Ooceraea biroi TaxID=2015173 RepID=A0A026VX79_OOCBI|nr:hypothetical protein X777_14155 [Ooceraea biroi]